MKWPFKRNKKSEQFAATPAIRRVIDVSQIDKISEMFEWSHDPDFVLQKLNKTRADLKKMESDDEIAQCLDTRKEAVVATPWHLEGDDESVNDFVRQQLSEHLETIIRNAWEAVPYGYSVIRVIYKRDDMGDIGGIDSIQMLPMEWFIYNRKYGWMNNLLQGNQPLSQIEKEYTHFFTVRNPTWNNPYGEALLSRAYWPWFFRHNTWKFWMQCLERFGTPFLIGKSMDTEKLFNALINAVQDAVIAVPEGDEVNIESSTGTPGGSFKDAEEALTRRIQKLILGQTLTSDVGSAGSYAAANVHDRVRQDKRNADIRLVSKTVQNIVDALVKLKFGADKAPPKFVMEDDLGLEKDRAERDKILNDIGVSFSESYINKTYDFDDGDITIQNQTKQPLSMSSKSILKLSADTNHQRFTDDQQAIENMADNMQLKSPIDSDAIKSAIRAATSPEDLEARLAVVLKDSDLTEFKTQLERALFAADIMGYAHAE